MFTVGEAVLTGIDGEERKCYFILSDGVPVLYEINFWLEYKGMNSPQTSKKYAYHLCRFLKYLYELGKTYKDVNKKDILNFINYLLNPTEDNVIQLESKISYSTAESYLTVIKEFYKYLEDKTNDETNLMYASKVKRVSKHSYFYGQIWDMDVKELLTPKLPRMKGSRDYVKWYSSDEIVSILSQFNTIRDRAIFALTLEGMRIDEVISLNLNDYVPEEQLVYIQKAKGNKERIVPLRAETAKTIEDYLYTERSVVESESELFEDALFLNLRKGRSYGKRIAYRNILKLIKRAGSRAGLDIEEVRTHSGRSTRTMELLHYQSENPDENLTDEQIRLLMGWSSSSSLEPYANKRDERLLISIANKINRESIGGLNDTRTDIEGTF